MRVGNPVLPVPPQEWLVDMKGNHLGLGDRIRMPRFPKGFVEGIIAPRPKTRLTRFPGHPGEEFHDVCVIADDGSRWECKPELALKITPNNTDVSTDTEERRSA